jgi:hypothetical protein
VAFELGVLLLSRHLSRALGIDVTSVAGSERWTRVALELYTHGLMTDDRFEVALSEEVPS